MYVPCVYSSITTPFDTGHSSCVSTEDNKSSLQCKVPDPCIPIFATSHKSPAWITKMSWFPRDTTNPLLVTLRKIEDLSVNTHKKKHNQQNIYKVKKSLTESALPCNSPLLGSQQQTFPSLSPLTRHFASGDHATARTCSLCPEQTLQELCLLQEI